MDLESKLLFIALYEVEKRLQREPLKLYYRLLKIDDSFFEDLFDNVIKMCFELFPLEEIIRNVPHKLHCRLLKVADRFDWDIYYRLE